MMVRFGVGVEMRIPVNVAFRDRGVFLNPQLIRYYYSNEVEFSSLPPSDEFVELGAETQIGLAIGVERPFNILGFAPDRFGLAYRFSDNLKAVVLMTGFPF